MVRKYCRGVCLIFVALGFCVVTALRPGAKVHAEPRGRSAVFTEPILEGVRFQGNRNAPTYELKGYILSNTCLRCKAPLRYDSVTAKRDELRLVNYYKKLGFLDVQVNHALVWEPKSAATHLLFRITEGDQHIVSWAVETPSQDRFSLNRVVVVGNRRTPSHRIIAQLGLETGQQLTVGVSEKVLEKIQKMCCGLKCEQGNAPTVRLVDTEKGETYKNIVVTVHELQKKYEAKCPDQ